ncbi:head decoration protein [Nocardioides sp. SOB77]|uniref:Head decoration protein n=1 Tax=Nocardioides oceani TaxID=3058369 RepID=A0ABT8FJ69_9ACTN|nr:head decoration protein [Nocardioides oceani]MDN4174727.1 head decoration protein [Nocardioides oceani]
MSDISLTTTSHQVEKRSWLLSQWGQGPGENPVIVLDKSAFTAGTHYPNGYIPSGEPLGKITATGLYGPYDNAAADGRETLAGFLHSSVKVPASDTDPGGALVVAGFVKESKLPRTVDSAGKADLKLVHFA